MKIKYIIIAWVACSLPAFLVARPAREERVLKEWNFYKGDPSGAARPGFDDRGWQRVTVPHDWAITGPFSPDEDLQTVVVTQNMERAPSTKTGRTGGLPFTGTGWYRTRFDVPATSRVVLVFDGAMSEARVHVNGREACYWPYGYNAFHVDITRLINADGKDNVVAVRLENKPRSSRWYPGAGLYREARLIVTGHAYVPTWGTRVTTPVVSTSSARVVVETTLEGPVTRIVTEIRDASGRVVAVDTREAPSSPLLQQFTIEEPRPWSPETPWLYEARSLVYAGDGQLSDEHVTRFGIREVKIDSTGFTLNGQPRKFRGVCNHHDLGPLGAAACRAALRHQLVLLKEMGCDAIRTAHNMPATALVELCDEMGFMLVVEAFDEWDVTKCENGYHRFFD